MSSKEALAAISIFLLFRENQEKVLDEKKFKFLFVKWKNKSNNFSIKFVGFLITE